MSKGNADKLKALLRFLKANSVPNGPGVRNIYGDVPLHWLSCALLAEAIEDYLDLISKLPEGDSCD